MGSDGELSRTLSQKTTFLGLKLWVLIGAGVAIFIVFILFILSLSLWLIPRKKLSSASHKPASNHIPLRSKEIKEVMVDRSAQFCVGGLIHTISDNSGEGESEKVILRVAVARKPSLNGEKKNKYVKTEPVEMQSLLQDETNSVRSNASGDVHVPTCGSDELHFGWGHWFTLRDLQIATEGFAKGNVLGEGGYGIVYKGQLVNGTTVAIKSFLNNMGQAERELRVEVEAIGRARHKHLVRFLGYCMEGTHRMLVYEFVNNGNLEQWLHGSLGSLTWKNRMKIILGTAKALAYLHEALEPKVVHRDIKASNILVDSDWNPKVSDFGLAKLLGAGKSHVKTRVMSTYGYVAPEYASSGLLNEKSDVYSFGVLLLETITGRDPVDYANSSAEVNLVEWLEVMVGEGQSLDVLDPSLSEKPPSRVLKRTLLIALRCVDPEQEKRPKMSHVVHLLESDEFPYRDVKTLLP